MVRPLAMPAAVAFVIALPIFVGAQEKKEPKAPDPRETVMTVSVDGGGSKTLNIKASGDPPGKSTTLRSEDGLKTATAETVASCKGKEHTTAPTTDPQKWCIQLKQLPGYGTVSGELAGGAGAEGSGSAATPDSAAMDQTEALTLTVNTRHAFFLLPLLAILIPLILSTFLLGPAQKLLSALIFRNKLELLLGRNAASSRWSRIEGLDELARKLKKAGKADEAVLGIVAPVVNEAPAKAAEARAALAAAIATHRLPATHPYNLAAQVEADRRDHRVTDFLKADGSPAPHPAADLEGGLAAMAKYRDQLADAAKEIAKTLVPSCQSTPLQKVGIAQTWWERTASRADIADLEEPFKEMRATIIDKQQTDNCRKVETRAASPRFTGVAADAVATPGEPGALSLSPGTILNGLVVLTALTILAVFLLAFETVRHGVYLADETFGSYEDYFKLATTALAAGAAATVAVLLAPWSKAAPAAAAGEKEE